MAANKRAVLLFVFAALFASMSMFASIPRSEILTTSSIDLPYDLASPPPSTDDNEELLIEGQDVDNRLLLAISLDRAMPVFAPPETLPETRVGDIDVLAPFEQQQPTNLSRALREASRFRELERVADATFFGLDPVNLHDPDGRNPVVGGLVGAIGGSGYAIYREIRFGEQFFGANGTWRYIVQGAAAGALIGTGAGAPSGLSMLGASGYGAAFGAGFGGAVGSVTSGGSWGGFAHGGFKGGILGAIGGATGFGIKAAGLSGGWSFAGSVAADTYAGVGIDAAFGDCSSVSGCFATNAAFSLGGNALAYGGTALLRSFRGHSAELPGLPPGYHYRHVGDNVQVVRNPGRALDLEPLHLEAGELIAGHATRISRSTATRNAYLRSIAEDPLMPSHMGQWLRRGELPPGYTVDHVQALFDGGQDVVSNMRLILVSDHIIRHKFYRPGGRVPSIRRR